MHYRVITSRLGGALLLIALALTTLFPTTAISQVAELESGRWDVEYLDVVLGKVSGIAEITESGDVSVSYAHPTTGAAYVLVAVQVQVRDGRLRIVLEGRSPQSAWQGAEHRPGTPIHVSENARGISARGESASNQTTMRLADRPETDLDRVTLELIRLEDGNYSGTWKYRGDPLSLRAADGFGRAGQPMTENGVTYISGPESWRKQRPEILGALDVADTSVLSPITSYPFLPNGSHVDRHDDLDLSRIIIVYGRNFTWSRQNPIDLEFEHLVVTNNPLANQAAPISYQILAYGSDYSSDASRLPQHEFDRIDLFYRRGREQIRLRLPEERRAEADSLDVLLIRATFKPGVSPGAHEFKIDEQPVDWLVRFSDATASIAFARETGTETDSRGKITTRDVEDTPWLFGPELFRIRVRTGVQLPMDQLPVVFGVDGEVKAIDGQPQLIARRSSWDKRLYLTKPIFLSNARIEELIERSRRFSDGAPGALPSTRIIVPTGTRLHALLGSPGLVVSSSALASAVVLDSPRATWQTPNATESANPWRAVLSRAAACHGIAITDWSRAPEIKIDSLWNVSLFMTRGSIVRKIDFRLGDHAAMLLLRRKFLEMMRVQKKTYEAIQSDVELIALYDLIRRMNRIQSAPFAALDITGPNGGSAKFRLALSREQNLLEFGLGREAARAWKIKATREMLTGFIAALERTIQSADSTPECSDPEKLLTLTGVGYGAVRRELLPALMTGDTIVLGDPTYQNTFAISTWRPDPIARAWVRGVDVIAEAVKSQRDLARVETAATLAVASFGTWGATGLATHLVTRMAAAGSVSVGTTAGITSASAYSLFAVDILGMAEFAVVGVPDYVARSKELEFSLGAAAVVGGGRYAFAYKNRQEWYELAGIAALNIAGTTYGAANAYKTAYDWRRTGGFLRRLSQGERTLENLTDIHQLNALDAVRRIEVIEFLGNARATLRAGGRGALTPAQRVGLAKYDSMLANNYGLGNTLPVWARRVNAETLDTLHTYGLMRRSDIQEMLRNTPRGLDVTLRGANRDHALEIMTSKPVRNWDQLRADMVRERGRTTNPILDFAHENTVVERYSLENQGLIFRTELDVDQFPASISIGTINFKETNGNILEWVGTKFDRSYNPVSGQFVFDAAFLSNVPSWIKGAPVALSSKGAPTTTVMNLMAMREVSIGFAGSGAPLNSVKLSTVVNSQTISELYWLKQIYPVDIPQHALKRLFSVQYADTAITQMGYKITNVEVGGSIFQTELRAVADDFLQRAIQANLANGLDELTSLEIAVARQQEFFSRYFGDNWRNLKLEIPDGPDIIVNVTPIQ